MSKSQSLVELYKGILAALVAQGTTEITRGTAFEKRQLVWATSGYGQNKMGAADSKALTEATKALNGRELFNVGPAGKRSKVRFVFN